MTRPALTPEVGTLEYNFYLLKKSLQLEPPLAEKKAKLLNLFLNIDK